jgi:hypothetical protein
VRTFTFKLTQYGLRDGSTPAPTTGPGSGRVARRRSRHATGGGDRPAGGDEGNGTPEN